jgi:hypothetical protein
MFISYDKGGVPFSTANSFVLITTCLLFPLNRITFFHQAIITHRHRTRLYYAVIPTRIQFGRVQRLAENLITSPVFVSSTIRCALIWSTLESTNIRNCQSIHTNCPITKPHGLTCRVSRSLDDFLHTGIPWFFRAIDDSWINPENVIEFLDQLETLSGKWGRTCSVVGCFSGLIVKSSSGGTTRNR